MSKITAELLESKNACLRQLSKFRELFPNGVDVTVELCVAHAAEFDWDWAADNLLSAPAYKAYKEACATAYKAYDEACAPAYKAYKEACATAYKAYDEACATAYKAYKEACATAYKAYKEACAPAYKAYKEACARSFAEQYLLQEQLKRSYITDEWGDELEVIAQNGHIYICATDDDKVKRFDFAFTVEQALELVVALGKAIHAVTPQHEDTY